VNPTNELCKTYWPAIFDPVLNPELKVNNVLDSSVAFFLSTFPDTKTDPFFSDVIRTSLADLFNKEANYKII
jgi:hypothetical protein